jgi:hypothetical protein
VGSEAGRIAVRKLICDNRNHNFGFLGAHIAKNSRASLAIRRGGLCGNINDEIDADAEGGLCGDINDEIDADAEGGLCGNTNDGIDADAKDAEGEEPSGDARRSASWIRCRSCSRWGGGYSV